MNLNTTLNNLILTSSAGIFISIIIIVALWNIVWKGMALWKAAKNNSKSWFIFLLIINTLGILEILYIYYFSKKKNKNNKINNSNE